MSISIESRERYQPRVDSEGRFVGGERDYQGRLEIIESEINFAGKHVLDLGCSGGFFTFSLASKAKEIVAVDADPHMIERNNEANKKLGYDNITFLNRKITPAFLEELPKFDVVLFLSVFHHMVTGLSTYDWTDSTGSENAFSVLGKIRETADVVVFEMGGTDEGFHWCNELGCRVRNLDEWIRKNVFSKKFHDIKKLDGPAYGQLPFKQLSTLRRMLPANRYGKRILREMGLDIRDFRSIYIGKR